MVIAWVSFLFTGIAATAPRENIFVNTSRDGAEFALKSRHKWCKVAKNGDNMGFFGKWRENGVIIA